MEFETIFRKVNSTLTEEDILMLAPLQLAYVGDAVYELLVRTYLLKNDMNVNELHKKSIYYVRAEAQAKFIHELDEILTEKEKSIVKKGRNAKTNTSPKHADLVDYKYSTGFEALFGYLYIKEEYDRIYELFLKIIEIQG